MIQLLNITDREIAEQVLRIQLPAYEVEAKLMNFYDIPPLHDTVDSIMESQEVFYGAFLDGKLAGATSVEKENQSLQICRLVVHPDFFRKGIGKQLVQHIFEVYHFVEKFEVSTGENNSPAKNLYKKLGFEEINRIEIAPNIYITCFEKKNPLSSNN
ncbi:GNAT family N-acetyltransferase [Bacillus sp. FJAT-49736]|uniref:GNAT family N-acetyltransferase n=1 Tax=Bacillus sp. FJAT-49736 TaxID=2833582 RepID=UPI001BC9C6DA|nr:GNAT family N-acetyltransferase [Bacillus sp. FJAT-49736]MBS4174596.1 GNAT family N-acetyltransferase [Bacillus sp. FJAT-49736]